MNGRRDLLPSMWLRLNGIKMENVLTGHASGRPCPMSSQLRLSPGTDRLFFCSCIHAHFAAFFRALATGFCASAAVFILMLLAFFGAGITDIGTEVT